MTETKICNMALSRIGARRINDYSDDTDTKNEAIQCRLHYEQTRDALQRSHFWVFNKKRVECSEASTEPDFQYDYQYLLPSDFLRYRARYVDGTPHYEDSPYSYSLERNEDGARVILMDDSPCNLIYSAKITDVAQFDPLFIEVLVLKLAQKLVPALAKTGKTLPKEIADELAELEPRVRALDRNEGRGLRKGDQQAWNDARLGGTLAIQPTVASS